MNTSGNRQSQRHLDGHTPERLLDAVQRLHGQHTAEDIAIVLLDEAAALCGAQRVLLALDTAQGLQATDMRLPPGEDAAALLRAITPWLIEANRTRKARLRHGPAGAAALDQRSCLVVPLIAPGGTIGHLYADIDGARGRFDARHQRVLGRLAAQAVVALDKTQWAQGLEAKLAERTDELNKSLRQQTATTDVLKVISRSTFDLKAMLQTLVESAAYLCDADGATIARQHGGHFYLSEGFGFSAEFMDYVKSIPTVPERGSITGRVLLEGRTVHIPDVMADTDFSFFQAQRLVDFRSMLGVPLLRDGRAVGVAQVRGRFHQRL